MSLTENPIDSSQATTTGSVDPVGTLFWIELVCATCKATAAGCWAARQIPVRQMKKDAKAEGWVFSGKHAYCSTKCSLQPSNKM